jgi:hypothetical protein
MDRGIPRHFHQDDPRLFGAWTDPPSDKGWLRPFDKPLVKEYRGSRRF